MEDFKCLDCEIEFITDCGCMKPNCPSCGKSSGVFPKSSKMTKKKLKMLEVIVRPNK